MRTPEIQHTYHDILHAIAKGKTIQWCMEGSDNWIDVNYRDTLREIIDEEYALDRYRVKPDTMLLNGIEVPRTMREAPPMDADYWFLGGNNRKGYMSDTWANHEVDVTRMNHVGCWATEEQVKEVVVALAKIFSD